MNSNPDDATFTRPKRPPALRNLQAWRTHGWTGPRDGSFSSSNETLVMWLLRLYPQHTQQALKDGADPIRRTQSDWSTLCQACCYAPQHIPLLLPLFQPLVASTTLTVLIRAAASALMHPKYQSTKKYTPAILNIRNIFIQGIQEALLHPQLCELSSSKIGSTVSDCLSMADYEVFDLIQNHPLDPHPFSAHPTLMLWESTRVSRLRHTDGVVPMPIVHDLITKWQANPNSTDSFGLSLAMMSANQNPSAFAALLPHIDGHQVKIDPLLIQPKLSYWIYQSFIDRKALEEGITPDISQPEHSDQDRRKF